MLTYVSKLWSCLSRHRCASSPEKSNNDVLAITIGKIAQQLLAKVDDFKWAVFVDIIGHDIQRTICRDSMAVVTADFITITGENAHTGSLTPILNVSGIVNDGHIKVVDLVDAVQQVHRTAKPLLISDTNKYKGKCDEGPTTEHGHPLWSMSSLLVPVLLQGVVYGVFRMCSDHKNVFRQQHVAYATIIASLLQTYLSTNRTTKLVRMSMQNQGMTKAPRRKPDIAQLGALQEET